MLAAETNYRLRRQADTGKVTATGSCRAAVASGRCVFCFYLLASRMGGITRYGGLRQVRRFTLRTAEIILRYYIMSESGAFYLYFN